MKKHIKLFSMLIALGMCVVTSCTKEAGIYTEGGSDGIIELADLPSRTSSTIYSIVTKSFDAATEIDFPVVINYTGTSGVPSDITLNVAINDAAVTAYNTASSTSYLILPSTLYTVATNTVTIPAGSKTGTFHIKLKTSSFDFSKSYALGISITSASAGTISGNYSTGIFRVVAKNAYEASYGVTGWFFHPTAGRAISATYAMSTLGIDKCSVPFGDLGSSSYNFSFDVSGSTLTNYAPLGSTPTGLNSGFMTADQAGASATWVNSSGSADKPGTSPWLHSTYNNSYDATNKTFYMHVGYVSTGGTGQASWTRQVYEKWVRK